MVLAQGMLQKVRPNFPSALLAEDAQRRVFTEECTRRRRNIAWFRAGRGDAARVESVCRSPSPHPAGQEALRLHEERRGQQVLLHKEDLDCSIHLAVHALVYQVVHGKHDSRCEVPVVCFLLHHQGVQGGQMFREEVPPGLASGSISDAIAMVWKDIKKGFAYVFGEELEMNMLDGGNTALTLGREDLNTYEKRLYHVTKAFLQASEDVLHQPPAEDKDVSPRDADRHSLDKLLDEHLEAKAGWDCG